VSKQLESFCSDAGCGRLGTARNPRFESDLCPLQNRAVSRMKTQVSRRRAGVSIRATMVTLCYSSRGPEPLFRFSITEHSEHTEKNPRTVMPYFRVFGVFRGLIVPWFNSPVAKWSRGYLVFGGKSHYHKISIQKESLNANHDHLSLPTIVPSNWILGSVTLTNSPSS
jgi:hypothetical protein